MTGCGLAGELHGREWHIVLAEELQGRPAAAAERAASLQPTAVAATAAADAFSHAIVALEVLTKESAPQETARVPLLPPQTPLAASLAAHLHACDIF